MNKEFDRAEFIVRHLREEGFEVGLGDRENIVSPIAALTDGQFETLKSQANEVVRFLACERDVGLFLARLTLDTKA